MRLITGNDIVGQMARWAVQLHPYHAPDGLFEVCAVIDEKAREQFTKDSVAGLSMRWFKDSWAVRDWLRSILADHPAFAAWNVPRSGPSAGPWVFSSRCGGPKKEDDFIDLDALLLNVSRDVWESARDFERAGAA